MYRIGYAKDIHALKAHRALILAGVKIPFSLGLDGHSDADVVFHAITESIFGALAVGDLGSHFPTNDDRYLNCDSSYFVEQAFKIMDERGYQINNIDVMIVAEKPKLAPYIQQMRENVARLLQTDLQNVSIKAGTNEGQDALGRNEAIEAIAIVMLKRKD